MAARRNQQVSVFVMPKLRHLQRVNRRAEDYPQFFPFVINEIPVQYVAAIFVFTAVICTYALWKYVGVRWSWQFAPTEGVAEKATETPEDGQVSFSNDVDEEDIFEDAIGDSIAPKADKTTIATKATSAGFPTPRQTKLTAKRLKTVVTTKNPRALLPDPSQEPKTEVTATFLSPTTEALSELSNGSTDAKHSEKYKLFKKGSSHAWDSASVELALKRLEAQSRNSDDLATNLKKLEALPRFKNINTYLYNKYVCNESNVSETFGTFAPESLPAENHVACVTREKKKKMKNVVMKKAEEKTYTDSDSRPAELNWKRLETKSSGSNMNVCKSSLKPISDAPCNISKKTKTKEATSSYGRRSTRLISNKAETRPICSKTNSPTTSLQSTSDNFGGIYKEKEAYNSSTLRSTKLTSKRSDTRPNFSKTNIPKTLLKSTSQAPYTIYKKKKKKKVSVSSSSSTLRSTMLTSMRSETEPYCSKKATPKTSLESALDDPTGISKKNEASIKSSSKRSETRPNSSKTKIPKPLLESTSQAYHSIYKKKKESSNSSSSTLRSAKLISKKPETKPNCSEKDSPKTFSESALDDPTGISEKNEASPKLSLKRSETKPNSSKTNIPKTSQAPHTLNKKEKKKVSFSSSLSTVRSTTLTSIRPETKPNYRKKATPKNLLESALGDPTGIFEKNEASPKLSSKRSETNPNCSKTNISKILLEPTSQAPYTINKKEKKKEPLSSSSSTVKSTMLTSIRPETKPNCSKKDAPKTSLKQPSRAPSGITKKMGSSSTSTPRSTKLTSKRPETRPNCSKTNIPKLSLESTSHFPCVISKKNEVSNSSTPTSVKLISKDSEPRQDSNQTSLFFPYPYPERATNVDATHGRPSSECPSHQTTSRCPSPRRRSTPLVSTRNAITQHSSPTHPSVSPASHARSRRDPDSPSSPSSPPSSAHTTIAQGSPPTQSRPTPTLTATSCQDHGVPTDASSSNESPLKSPPRLDRQNLVRLGSSNITSDAAVVDLELRQSLKLVNKEPKKSSRCNSPTRNAPSRWTKPLRKRPVQLESGVLKCLRNYNNDVLISNRNKLNVEDVSTKDDHRKVGFRGYSGPEEKVDSDKSLAETRLGDDCRLQDDMSAGVVTESRGTEPDVTCPDVTQPDTKSGPKESNITTPEVTLVNPTSLQKELAMQQINAGPEQTCSKVGDTPELTQTIAEKYESKSYPSQTEVIFIDVSFKGSEEDVPEDGWQSDLTTTPGSLDLTALGRASEDSIDSRQVEESNTRRRARSLDTYIPKPPLSTYLRATPSLQCDAVATRMPSATQSTENDVLSVPEPSAVMQLRIPPRSRCRSLPAVISPSSIKTAKRKSEISFLRKHYPSPTTQNTMPAPTNPQIMQDVDTVEKIDVPCNSRDATDKTPKLVTATLNTCRDDNSISMRELLSEIVSPLRTERVALSRRAKSVTSRTQVVPTRSALLASITQAEARSEMPSISTSVLPTRKRWSQIDMSDLLSDGRHTAFYKDFCSDRAQRLRLNNEPGKKSKQGTMEEVLSDEEPCVYLQSNVTRNTKTISLTRMKALLSDLEPQKARKSDRTSEETTENSGTVQHVRSTLPTKSLTLETLYHKKALGVLMPTTEPAEPLSVDVAVGLPTPRIPTSGNTPRCAQKSEGTNLLASDVADLSESLPKPAINVNVLTAMSEVASEKPSRELGKSGCNEGVYTNQLEREEGAHFIFVGQRNPPAPKRLGARFAGRNMSKATPWLRISKPVAMQGDLQNDKNLIQKYKNLQNDQNPRLKIPPGSKKEHNSVQKIPRANTSQFNAMITTRNKYKATPRLKISNPVHVKQDKVLNKFITTSKSDQVQDCVAKNLIGSDISKQVSDNEGARTQSATIVKTTPKLEISTPVPHDKQDSDFKTLRGSKIPKRDAIKGQYTILKRLQGAKIPNRYFKSNQGARSLSPQLMYFASQTLDRNVLMLTGKLKNLSKQVSNNEDCLLNVPPNVLKSNENPTKSHMKLVPHMCKYNVLKSPRKEQIYNKFKVITKDMVKNSLEPYNSKVAPNYDLTSSILELPQQVLDNAQANFVEKFHLQSPTNIFTFHGGDSAPPPYRKYFFNVNCKRKTYFRLPPGPKKRLRRKGVPGKEKLLAKKVQGVELEEKVIDIQVEEVTKSAQHVKPSSQSSLYRVDVEKTLVHTGKAEAASESSLTERSSWLNESQLRWLARRNKARGTEGKAVK